MKKIALLVAFCATISQLFAQANCGATAALIQTNSPSPVVCLGSTTPTPVLTDTGSILPNLEYVLVNNTQLLSGQASIVAANATGVFDLNNYPSINNGDEVCVVPVRFDFNQVRDLVDKILNGSYSAGLPCCNLVESLLDGVCEEMAAQGVTGASSVTDLGSIFAVVEVLSGEALTIDRFVNTVGTLNQYGPFLPSECGGGTPNIPVCFAVDGTVMACYIKGFAVDAENLVYIDSAMANGMATVSPLGGTSPYNYSWSNNATTSTITNLGLGTYTVTITDNNNCAVVETVEVLDSCALLIFELTVIPVSCYNGNDGLIQITPLGGNPNYTVTPANGAAQSVTAGNRATFISLSAGQKTYTITDNGGCNTQVVVNLVNPEPITLQVTSLPDTLDLDTEDSLYFSIDTLYGGDFPVNLMWDFDNGVTSAAGGGAIAYNSSGTYTIEVAAVDTRNCRATYSHTLTVIGGTGINEIAINKLIKLYPNPTMGIVNIEANEALLNKSFTIYNINGQSVLSGVITNVHTNINIEALPVGVYGFQVDGTNAWKKLVVVQ